MDLELDSKWQELSAGYKKSGSPQLGHGSSTKRRCSLRLSRKTCLPESQIFRLSMINQEVLPETKEDIESDDLCAKEKSVAITNEESSFMDPSSLDSLEVESICLAILGAILHHSTPSNNTYLSYIQKALRISKDQFDSLYRQARKEESKELHLDCCVRGASYLQPKNLKILPDVICHLTVLSQDKFSRFSGNMFEWKEKEIIPEMWTTKFSSSTLSPTWNETFALGLSDPSKEMVVIEIWGRKNKTKAKSSDKQKEYFKKEDNFIGRAFYLLKTTPIEGEERVLSLYSHSGKHERGKVTLQLAIKGQREDVPVGVSIREHILLLKLIVDQETKMNGSFVRSWNAKLSTEAENILFKHAEYGKISAVQVKSVRLLVLLEYHKFRGVKLVVIADLLEEIMQHKLFLEKEAKKMPFWVKQLIYEMKIMHSMQLDVISGHLVNYNIKAIDDITEIESCIRILVSMDSFTPLLDVLEQEKRNLKIMMEINIQVAVPTWFLELSRKLLPSTDDSYGDGELELIALRGLCVHCLKHAQRAYQTLNPIFKRAGVDYFSTFYITLDKLLCGESMPRIKHFNNRANDQIVYELYVAFKDLSKLSDNIDSSHHKNLEILDFHTFFSGLPVPWIDLATHKCKKNIEKAITFDEDVKSNLDQPRFSSSALDAEGLLLQLGLFWKNLEWPVPTDAFGYLCSIVEQLSQLALFYVDAINQSLLLDSNIMYDESGRFQSSERLCIILNNMYHVKLTLTEMPKTLELESYYGWLEAKKPRLGEKAKKLVSSLFSSHDEDIENKISFYIDRITNKLTVDISSYFELIVPCNSVSTRSYSKLKNVRHLSSILKTRTFSSAINEANSIRKNRELEEQITNDEAITPLLNYLTANLQILGDYLLTPVLNSILHKLWNFITGTAQGKLLIIPRCISNHYLYERLEYFMHELKFFFNAEGNGMSIPNLETDSYKFIMSKLVILQTSSQDLLERFLWELSEQQKYLEPFGDRDGTLQLSIAYLIDKQAVEISIIQAKNLPGNSQLNTHVEIFLLPKWHFPSSRKRISMTSVIEGTTNPFYGEEFLLPAREESMEDVGAVVILFVCDSDTSDILGINALHCMEIPHLYAHIDSLSQGLTMPERKNLTMTLFLQRDSSVLKEILTRVDVDDPEIVEFYRSNKRLFENIQIRRSSVTKWLTQLP